MTSLRDKTQWHAECIIEFRTESDPPPPPPVGTNRLAHERTTSAADRSEFSRETQGVQCMYRSRATLPTYDPRKRRDLWMGVVLAHWSRPIANGCRLAFATTGAANKAKRSCMCTLYVCTPIFPIFYTNDDEMIETRYRSKSTGSY